MDQETANILNRLTSEFYRKNAASFSLTRARAWDGWERCLSHLNAPTRVLDLGCGNLRFETFLAKHLEIKPELWAVDNCPELLDKRMDVHFQQLDIISTLLTAASLADALDAPACELCCAYGLMHHIPTSRARFALLEGMLEKTCKGGYAIVAFWQFEHDERLARKALATTQVARQRYPQLVLDENDYLLGWQNSDDTLRYCHSYSDNEIDRLIQHVASSAKLIDRFHADGKSGNLNCYLVFQKTA